MQNEHTFMKKLHNNIVTGIKTFPELTYKYTTKQKTPLQTRKVRQYHAEVDLVSFDACELHFPLSVAVAVAVSVIVLVEEN